DLAAVAIAEFEQAVGIEPQPVAAVAESVPAAHQALPFAAAGTVRIDEGRKGKTSIERQALIRVLDIQESADLGILLAHGPRAIQLAVDLLLAIAGPGGMGVAMDQPHELRLDGRRAVGVHVEPDVVAGLDRDLVGIPKYLLLGHGR